MTSVGPREVLRVTLREARMVVERVLLHVGLPLGLVPDVRDAIVYAEAIGLNAFSHLQHRPGAVVGVPADALRIHDGPALSVDARGAHAWVAAPSLLDLTVEALADKEHAIVEVRNVCHADQLAVIPALAGRSARCVEVSVAPERRRAGPSGETLDGVRIVARVNRSRQARDAVLSQLIAEGLPVDVDLWHRLIALSNRALTPDSPESRRHAGPVIVTDDGRIIGRADGDDDTDFGLLRGERAR